MRRSLADSVNCRRAGVSRGRGCSCNRYVAWYVAVRADDYAGSRSRGLFQATARALVLSLSLSLSLSPSHPSQRFLPISGAEGSDWRNLASLDGHLP